MNITHHKNGEIKTLVEEAPYHPGYEDAVDISKQYVDKSENNRHEPVAWMYETELQDGTTVKRVTGVWELKYKYIVDACDRGNPIPLYTHPAKTLTDEEIKQVWQENLVVMGNDLDFARAILRKAQEK